MRLLRTACPACHQIVGGWQLRLAWRLGITKQCPNCGADWALDRHLVWAATSTPAGFASALGYVIYGWLGALVVFFVLFVPLELLGLLVLRPRRPQTP